MPATLSPPRRAVARPMTVADLEALPRWLPSGPIDYELRHGALIPMAPPGFTHGFQQSAILFQLQLHGQRPGHGLAVGESGLLLGRRPDTLLAPDAAFILTKSLPVKRTKEGYLATIPELVVEVKSKNDSAKELAEKVAMYLAAGVDRVWVLDGSKKTVTVHTSAGKATLFAADTLTADGLIPGFAVSVAELFSE
jgi:Uma2 family endonuclease